MSTPKPSIASRLRSPVLLLSALVLSSSCLNGASAPDGPPRGKLSLGAEPEARGDSAPFAVVFGAPRGPTVDPPEISLVFNRPMVPLELAGNEPKAPVTLTPDVKGRWHWVGTSALTFIPEGHLPRATEIAVEVPKGTKSLGGETLDKAYSLRFSTLRPRVVRVDTDGGDDSPAFSMGRTHLRPESTFTLWLNQPVDAAELLRAVTLTATNEPAPIPFEVKQRDADNPQVFVLTPRKKLPLASDIGLGVSADLRGKEGPLTAGEAASFEMSTYGPFSISEVRCSEDAPGARCSFDGGISITTSNHVELAALKKAVRAEPGVTLRWPSWMDEEDTGSHFYVYGNFKPGKRVNLTIDAAGLKDVYGQPLAGSFTKSFDFGDLWPSAEIGVSGTYIEPGTTSELPVYHVNARDAEVAAAALTEQDIIDIETSTSSSPLGYDRILLRKGALAKKLVAGGVNTVSKYGVPLEDLLGKNGRGPVHVGVRYTDRPGTRFARTTEETRVVHVTDLSIGAKISPEGSLVWVTSLSTGAPVPSAEVTIRWKDGALPGRHVTDKDGLVRISKADFSPKMPHQEDSVLVVRSGSGWSYRAVRDVFEGWRFGAPVRWEDEPAFGLVFTDAGIYRPGQTVKVKGMLREPLPKGLRTPAERSVELKVESSDGQTIASLHRVLSAYGTFDADVVIPATGRLGTYHVWAELAGAGTTDAYATFEVAEYRPAEIKVAAETDRPSYVRGDKLACTVRGDYLYGAPMARADTHVLVSRRPTGFSPPGPDDYSVSDEPYSWDLPDLVTPEPTIVSKDGALDDKGALTLAATLAMPAQRGPEAVTCEASVTDVTRQSSGTTTTAIVHPAEHYIALRPGDDMFVGATDTLKPTVLALDPRGKKLAGKSVKLELVRRTWTVARQKTPNGGIHRVSTPVDKVVSTCSVTTAESPVSCDLKPASPGYHLVRATGVDSRKNTMAASASVYVTGDSTSGWRDGDDGKLDLVTDKKSYAVGQTARVIVKSPFPSAEALVTVERSGVYTVSRQTLKGSMPTVSIPITDDLRPNAFVSVLLVRGRSKAPPKDPKGADVGAPTFRFGAAELKVDPEARRLAVTITPDSADKRPGQEISVNADVKDHQGKPARAEVTLYAVDEGVLTLVDYRVPDPVLTMSQPRPLRVATLESRDALARTWNPFASLGLDKGKDGGDGADAQGRSFRKDFRTSAYFHPTLVTDDKGRVSARFKLPESLTTYRIMAVAAATDDRFGYAQSHVTTSRPLMARPALPRFLRAGDTIDAGVVVTSKGMARASVDVELSAEGVTTKGPTKKTVDLDPGQSVEVRFAMDAPKVGQARLRFVAKGGGEEDRVEVVRKVSPPLSLEAVALYGDTTSQAVEALGDMSAIRDDTGGLQISSSSTALIGLDAGVEQLIEYPYGCTEQLTSRLVPLLPLRQLAADYGFPLPRNVDGMVTEAVAKILAHQKGDGGFGLWAESERSSPWLTAYALWGLTHAEKGGVAVPEQALQSATRYLERSLEDLESRELERAAIPFILDVLAERGKADVARMNNSYSIRGRLPLFARAQLLHAMAIAKAEKASIDTLASELEAGLRLDGPVARVVSNHGDSYAVLLDSDTRSSALVLRGLLAARADHPMAVRLVRGILDDRKGGTWRTTQETAWALLAIDDYRRRQEKVTPNFLSHVFLGDKEIGAHRFEGRSLDQASTTVSASQVVASGGAALGFKVDGSGHLFYQARLRYAKRELPQKPLDRGFFVQKTLRPVEPEQLAKVLATTGATSVASFTGGDLVLGEVTVVTTTPRRWVVVDDPLPAGFEAIDARLATTAPSLDVDDAGDDSAPSDDDVAMGEAYFSSSFIREVRDDRVLFFVDEMSAGMYRYRYLARATTHGTFVLPPARAEEMYAPEVFGRTAAGTITVAPK